MKFDVLTVFPEIINSTLQFGVVGQACKKNLLQVQAHNLRQWTEDVHGSVDDRPYGGGDGMVFLPEILTKALVGLKTAESHVVYLSPQGKKWTANKAKKWSSQKHIILISGRYAGVDQRFINEHIDEEISVGDFVLSGGEVPALAIIDSVARWLPGVLGHESSAEADSFSNGLLEAPLFTRPQDWQGRLSPEILLSGHHAKITDWKTQVSLLVTAQKRPDLFRQYLAKLSSHEKISIKQKLFDFYQALSDADKGSLGLDPDPQKWRCWLQKPLVAVGLVHYPILDQNKKIVATNITNFDIHDIARACRVYGVDQYYIIHPMREQLMFVERVLDHWRTGRGAAFNPMRRTALGLVQTSESLEKAIADWHLQVGPGPVIATHARPVEGAPSIDFTCLRENIWQGQGHFIVFGTGFGLTEETMRGCSAVLESIQGSSMDDYRHLSVRSAVSICLDRLLSP
ncbi:MAG: tRNA (guanosine(37)-N1)-methyltransferase TrmD [Pseudobdellovibrionaceae bacterium]